MNSLVLGITVDEFYMRSITILYFVVIGVFFNSIMSKQMQSESALKDSEVRYRMLFNSCNDALFVHQPSPLKYLNKFIEVNDNACQRLGYTKEELLNLTPLDISIPDQNNTKKILKKLRTEKRAVFEAIHRRKNGMKIPVEISSNQFKLNGELTILSIVRDITERKKMEEKLKKAASTDPLTGLSNRRDFNQKIKNEIIRFNRNNRPFSIILGDIDFFKKINDMYGHECGDYVLKSIAKIMKSSKRQLDVICRWGGEEFIALLPETDLQGGEKYAEKIRQKISSNTFHFRDNTFKATICFGVVIFDLTMSLKEVINSADKCLYKAKSEGRNRVIVNISGKSIQSI